MLQTRAEKSGDKYFPSLFHAPKKQKHIRVPAEGEAPNASLHKGDNISRRHCSKTRSMTPRKEKPGDPKPCVVKPKSNIKLSSTSSFIYSRFCPTTSFSTPHASLRILKSSFFFRIIKASPELCDSYMKSRLLFCMVTRKPRHGSLAPAHTDPLYPNPPTLTTTCR